MNIYSNKYGVAITKLYCPINSPFINTNYVYIILADDLAKYASVYPGTIVLQDTYSECNTYEGTLELEILSSHLPMNDKHEILGHDSYKFDFVIPCSDKVINYTGLMKADIKLPKDFFEEDVNKVIVNENIFMEGPIINIPKFSLN